MIFALQIFRGRLGAHDQMAPASTHFFFEHCAWICYMSRMIFAPQILVAVSARTTNCTGLNARQVFLPYIESPVVNDFSTAPVLIRTCRFSLKKIYPLSDAQDFDLYDIIDGIL